jgi:Ca-activated chloride channel homolog
MSLRPYKLSSMHRHSSRTTGDNIKNLNAARVLITPLGPALIRNVAQKLPILVHVQAPDAAPTMSRQRKPYRLSRVLDRSGSMSGDPLHEAVRCARHIIDRLAPTDVASLAVVVQTATKTLLYDNRAAVQR